MTLLGRGRHRQIAASQNGFTLVELLVTVVVIGILAAIALPAFLNQQNKATDASAKAMVHHGALAMQTFAAENDNYNATKAEVLDIAPELDGMRWALSASAAGYTISVTTAKDHVYSIERGLSGPALRTCSSGSDPTSASGCSSAGTW